MISCRFPIIIIKGFTQNVSESEVLTVVEKINLDDKKVPENLKFYFSVFHLPKSSEKNTRHSESPPGTSCSVLIFFRTDFYTLPLLTFCWARDMACYRT